MLTRRFFQRKENQNTKYLENKKRYSDEIKNTFHYLQGPSNRKIINYSEQKSNILKQITNKIYYIHWEIVVLLYMEITYIHLFICHLYPNKVP